MKDAKLTRKQLLSAISAAAAGAGMKEERFPSYLLPYSIRPSYVGFER